jgi:frataxin-like iron-binding protein CyaY
MRAFLILHVMLVAAVAVDQAALEGRHTNAIWTEAKVGGGQFSHDVRQWIKRNLPGQ